MSSTRQEGAVCCWKGPGLIPAHLMWISPLSLSLSLFLSPLGWCDLLLCCIITRTAGGGITLSARRRQHLQPLLVSRLFQTGHWNAAGKTDTLLCGHRFSSLCIGSHPHCRPTAPVSVLSTLSSWPLPHCGLGRAHPWIRPPCGAYE